MAAAAATSTVSPPNQSMRASATLSEADIAKVITFIEQNREAIGNRKPIQGVTRYHAGHHRQVFECSLLPGRVIKIDGSDQEKVRTINEAMAKARTIVQQKGLTRCHVPEACVSPCERGSIWIEERLEGTYDANEATDASEREFARIGADKTLFNKWLEIFTQAATLIAETGYNDVDFRNLLLMTDGLGFVDFEGVSGKYGGHGILRLLMMAPLEYFDPILKIVEKYRLQEDLFSGGMYGLQEKGFRECASSQITEDGKGFVYRAKTSFENAVVMLKELRKEQLELNAAIRAFHEKNGIVKADTKVDASKYESARPLGKVVIERFNAVVDDNAKTFKGNLRTSRKLSWQPFSSTFNFKTMSLVDPAVRASDKAELEKALDALKTAGAIAAWKGIESPHRQITCHQYEIHF